MPTVQLSGLASGFDWQSYIGQIMDIEQAGVDAIKAEQNQAELKISALDRLAELFEGIQDASDDLRSGTSDYYDRKVTLGTPEGEVSPISASADGTTPVGTYDVEILKVATASVLKGGKASAEISDSSVTLADLSVASNIEAGTFTVNGSVVEIETTDTLDDVFQKISDATGGVITASLSSDRMVLNTTGERITLGAASDTSNFLEVMKLYTDTSETPLASIQSSSGLGSTNVNILMEDALDTSSLSGLVDGKGSIVINGETIEFDTTKDSLRSLMTEINESAAGVLINYDPGSDKFKVTSNETGSLDIVLDDPNGLFEMMGLTSGAGAAITYGDNAEFTIDGGATIITSNSNTLDESKHGIPGLEIVARELGTETMEISADTEVAKGRIDSFISAYNSFADAVDYYTETSVETDGTVSTSILSGNREVSSWKSMLRSLIFSEVDTGNAELSRIFHLGIDFDEDGQLSIEDEDELNDWLKNDPSSVAKLFNSNEEGNQGVARTLYDSIEAIIKTGGSYDTQVNTLEKKMDNLDDEIDDKEREMELETERMTKSFVAMEEMQSRINQQLSTMQSILGL